MKTDIKNNLCLYVSITLTSLLGRQNDIYELLAYLEVVDVLYPEAVRPPVTDAVTGQTLLDCGLVRPEHCPDPAHLHIQNTVVSHSLTLRKIAI